MTIHPSSQPPAPGNIYDFTPPVDTSCDLPASLVHRSDPKQPLTLGHVRIHKTGTDVCHPYRQPPCGHTLAHPLQIIHLERFRGIIGRCRPAASQAAHRGDSRQMPLSPVFKTPYGPVRHASPSRHVRIQRTTLHGVIQLRIQVSRPRRALYGLDEALSRTERTASAERNRFVYRGDARNGECHPEKIAEVRNFLKYFKENPVAPF